MTIKKKFLPILLIVLVIAAFMSVPVLAQGEIPAGADPGPIFDMAAISNALQNLLVLILVPCAGFLAKWLLAKSNVETEKLSEANLAALKLFLSTCGYAAEQMKAGQYISNKLDYVTKLADAWIEKKGLSLSTQEIRAYIEAMVKQEFNANRSVTIQH